MRFLSCRGLALSCLVAAIPGSLFAVDGVVLIDQNHAIAGGVTPGDTPGFPVTLSQPGSYRLSGNLTVPNLTTTAIKITSDSVSLDLNGFSISGPAVCNEFPTTCPPVSTGIGVQAENAVGLPGPRGARVFNGTVRGMGSVGIILIGDGSQVDRVTVSGNAGTGMVINGSISNSTASGNGNFGLFGIIVRDSIAVQNASHGIQLDGSGGVGTGNIASFNGGNGMNVPNGTVIGNTLVRNGKVAIEAICPSTIVNNLIIGDVAGTITTSRDGCVVQTNATRP